MRKVGRDAEEKWPGQTEFPSDRSVILFLAGKPRGINTQRHDADLICRNAEFGRDFSTSAL